MENLLYTSRGNAFPDTTCPNLRGCGPLYGKSSSKFLIQEYLILKYVLYPLSFHYACSTCISKEWKSMNIWMQYIITCSYSKTCLKRSLKKKTKLGFQDRLSLNAGQKYCRMLREHSAILFTFILQYFRPSIKLVATICH